MFQDDVVLNLLLFGAGQATAFGWLRTGCIARGFLLMIVIWVAADWALVARFVFADRGPGFVGPLLVMQVAAVLETLLFAAARVRRRFGELTRRRSEVFAAGLRHYLRGELDDAAVTFRRLRKHDRWDVASAIALGNVRAAQGRTGEAGRLWRAARAADRAGEYGDFVAEQLRRLG